MSEEAKTEENPVNEEESMEEILHSIRDIIADGDEEPNEDNSQSEDENEEEEIIDLTEVVGEADTTKDEESLSKDVLEDIDAALEDDKNSAPPPAEEVGIEAETPAEETKETPPPAKPTVPTQTLVDDATANASAAAMKDLVDNIPRPNIERKDFRSGNTVEDLALEALNPMLKQWLDNNLENIVKEIVEREIKKLLPRG